MTPTDSPAPEMVRLLRAVRSLLALTACLLALLVLGLGVGAWYTVQRLGHLEARALAQAEQWRGLSVELGQEATRRQSGMSTGLLGESQSTQTRLAALTEQRRRLSGHPPDPLAKIDRVIDISLMMADEMLLLLRHTVDTQATVGKSLRPLPKQKELSRPGSAP